MPRQRGKAPLPRTAPPHSPQERWLRVGAQQRDLALAEHGARCAGLVRIEPGRGRRECGLRVGPGAQSRGHAIAVLHQGDHAEVDVAARRAALAHQADLRQHFVGRPLPGAAAPGVAHAADDGAGEDARPEVARATELRRPIVEQRREGLARLVDGPVELWCQVVEPALLHPTFDIGVELVVLAEALDAGGAQVRPAQAERADAEAQLRLDAVHGVVQGLHQAADVVAPPVVAA